MNPETQRKINQALDKLERRRPGRRRAGSTAPMMLGLALLLGYQLLVRLVPRVWSEMLPGGLMQARRLGGLPGLVFHLAEWCYVHVMAATIVILGAVVLAWLVGRFVPMGRWIVWLGVIVAIGLNAGILVVMLATALRATAIEAGFP